MVHVHERPVLEGWVYPCSVDDLKAKLAAIPPAELAGLWAVVLAPSTRRDYTANARYFRGEKPEIHIYSHPASLEFKMPVNVRCRRDEPYFWVELEHGMELVKRGGRTFSRWKRIEDLRDFIVNHVLLHEIGHHVFYRDRTRRGFCVGVTKRFSEQFAEHYALRMSRENRRS